MDELIEGTWSGLMLDAHGYRARATLRLDESDGEVRGEIDYALIAEHEEEKHQGAVSGKVSDRDEVSLQIRLEDRRGEMVTHFSGHLMPLEEHAEATLYGSYEVSVEGQRRSSAGVAIFWKYADKQ